jgi:3,2-trans-enoyl-CoA isomerase
MNNKFLRIENKGKYVVVQMHRPKVNAINFDFVNEFRTTFQALEADESVEGVILTGLPGVFSAGLDLFELYNYDKAKMDDFFIAFSRMHLELVRFTKPFICAITGHSPAGGTVIAVAADYRVMAEGEKFSIGLNEVAVNIQISDNLINAYSFWLGRNAAYRNILEGNLLNPQSALACGLVDEVVPLDQVLERAEAKIQHYLKAEKSIWLNTKAKLRKDWLDSLKEDQTELELTNQIWWSPTVRAKMRGWMEQFRGKKK